MQWESAREMETNRLLSRHSWGDNAHLTSVEFFFFLDEFEFGKRGREEAELNGLLLSCAGVGVVTAMVDKSSQLFLSPLPRRRESYPFFNRKN